MVFYLMLFLSCDIDTLSIETWSPYFLPFNLGGPVVEDGLKKAIRFMPRSVS